MIPLLAMQFTDDVNWSIFDFVVMGFLLLFFSLGIDITMKKVKNQNVKNLKTIIFNKKIKEQKLLINILRKSYKKRNSRKKFGEDFYTVKKISKKINKKIKFYSLGSSKKTNQILRNISN